MEYSDVEGFAADAAGEPGARTFLLQLTGPWGRHTYLVEKAQVDALAAGIDHLISETDDVPDLSVAATSLIKEPPRFRVAHLGLGYDESIGLGMLTIASVAVDDDEITYRLTLHQLAAAARQGAAAVAGGRPPCPKCGLAMDPEGHACPTTNGDLRHHRP